MMSVNNYQNTSVIEDIRLTLLVLSHLLVMACCWENNVDRQKEGVIDKFFNDQ